MPSLIPRVQKEDVLMFLKHSIECSQPSVLQGPFQILPLFFERWTSIQTYGPVSCVHGPPVSQDPLEVQLPTGLQYGGNPL